MSDTPRTDAQGYGDGRHPYVPTEFARELERELAAVTEQRDRLAEAIRKHRDELELTSGDAVDRILWNTLKVVGGRER